MCVVDQAGFADIGIYRPIHLNAFHTAIIRDVVVIQRHADRMTKAQQLALSLHAGDVLLNVTAYLRIAHRSSSDAVEGVVSACVAGVCVNSSALYLHATVDQSGDALLPVSIALRIPSPLLWWPHTLGNATLYPLTLNLITSVIEHTLTRRIGFRTVDIVRVNDSAPGLTMHFHVNGVPLYLKGANVVPLDSFHARVVGANLTRLVDSARASHLNVLRVWGGGIVQLDDFYDRADEVGIMLWTELPFACAMYPTWSVERHRV